MTCADDRKYGNRDIVVATGMQRDLDKSAGRVQRGLECLCRECRRQFVDGVEVVPQSIGADHHDAWPFGFDGDDMSFEQAGVLAQPRGDGVCATVGGRLGRAQRSGCQHLSKPGVVAGEPGRRIDPNARYLNGFSADAISTERVARWKNPAGGYIHALQRFLWGSLHFRITGKNADNTLHYEGGWQINSGNQPMHKEYLFVENIFEELDAPGEWFLDERSSTLYFYPPAGVDLDKATVDIVRLKNLVTIGEASSPFRYATSLWRA